MQSRLDGYQAHVDRLARELGCEVRQRPSIPGMMFVELGYITGPMIRNQQDYLALLHELGHFAHGHTQGRPPHDNQRWYFENGVLRSEAEAWEWAMNECQDPIEYVSRGFMWDFCLGSYYQNSLHTIGPTRLMHGDRHHVAFLYDKPDEYFASVVRQMQGGQTNFEIPFPERMPLAEFQEVFERWGHRMT